MVSVPGAAAAAAVAVRLRCCCCCLRGYYFTGKTLPYARETAEQQQNALLVHMEKQRLCLVQQSHPLLQVSDVLFTWKPHTSQEKRHVTVSYHQGQQQERRQQQQRQQLQQFQQQGDVPMKERHQQQQLGVVLSGQRVLPRRNLHQSEHGQQDGNKRVTHLHLYYCRGEQDCLQHQKGELRLVSVQQQQISQQLLFMYAAPRQLHNSYQAVKLRRRLLQRDKHLDFLPSRRQRQQQAQAAAAWFPSEEEANELTEAIAAAGKEKPVSQAPLQKTNYLAEARGLLRVEKEKFLRDLLQEHHAISMLFTEEQRAELLGTETANAEQQQRQQGSIDSRIEQDRRRQQEQQIHEKDVKEKDNTSDKQAAAEHSSSPSRQQELDAFTSAALRTYRLLKPDALPFYKEDSLLSLQSRLNEATLKQSPMLHDMQRMGQQKSSPPTDLLPPDFNALQFNLPVVNPTAFLLALAAAAESLAADIEKLCLLLQVPGIADIPSSHPFRLKLLLDALWDSFKLRKNPLFAAEWANQNWPRLQRVLPPSIAALSAADVGLWLQQHLERVTANQQNRQQQQRSGVASLYSSRSSQEEEFYSLADDFLYDDAACMSSEFLFERNSSFPLHKAGDLFRKIADFLQLTTGPHPVVNDAVIQQFQRLVHALNRIGLSTWMQMNTKELEKYLPEGDVFPVTVDEKDLDAARLLLKAAARGKANLLDFEAFDPYKLLYGFDVKTVESEEKFLSSAGPATWLRSSHSSSSSSSSSNSAEMHAAEAATAAGGQKSPQGKEREEEEYVEWRWKRPLQSVFDSQKNIFIRERQGVDATLQLHSLRQTLLSINRMMSMNKQGRVYYFRAIVGVGNGRGVFGLGIAFGSSTKAARSNAALAALQQLQLLDIDTDQTLTTPVSGKEYSAEVKTTKEKEDVYTEALKRALQQLQSRRTIANATGQKYDLLLAPGGHWVHWPDRWFRPIVRDYQQMLQKIKEKRHRTYRRGFRSNISEVIPEECRPEFTPYTWKSPLQRWAEALKKKRLIAHNIYEKDIYVNPPRIQKTAPDDVATAKKSTAAAQYIDTHVVGPVPSARLHAQVARASEEEGDICNA